MVVLYYHGVPSGKRAGFTRQMSILARHAHVVPADWCGAVHPTRPTVAITFDDAFTSVFDNALPELAARKFSCTIFAPSGALGRSPDWAMESGDDSSETVADAGRLKECRGPDIIIGAHSVSHPHLTRIPPERARAEIAGSCSALAELTNSPITLFAFPYGDCNARIVDICRQQGMKHVFTIVPQLVDPRAKALVRGRVAVEADDGPVEFYLKMSGAYAWMPWASTAKRQLRSLTHRAVTLCGRFSQ